ncbi:hypothetical protein FHT44_005882 [Mycolicibacterium sp. BK634]|uniref:hypothetical protein n=1 Tax=Mycobacteriaceae TaxID=1762 RepID=UPI00105E4194|nr:MULTISPECIES: hypothetical protein [Mycobacteriaceae]MBB3753363.1 hypothetical protein [Mycolicibacterium sp. BK634]
MSKYAGTMRGDAVAMKTLVITTGGAAIVAATALTLAPAASAVPLEGGPADVVVSTLQARGFTVQINGSVPNGLSRCTVTSINGLRGTEDGGEPIDRDIATTVFVSVDCLH